MKKCFLILIIVFGCMSFASASTFSIDGLASSQLHFIYHGNQFGGTIFFRDTQAVTETLMLNGIPKSCNQQIR
ncbi:MAG: hypothetical protein WCJ39_09030 [bacterium]